MKIKYDFSAEHIWISKNGHRYVNEDLKYKKTVTTSAQLQRIAHNNSENDTVSLKIGRYKFNGDPETATPKSELTLDEEELSNLLTFIDKYLKPLKSGVDAFIPVDGTQTSELLKKFKELSADDSEKAKALLDSGILNSDISIAIENAKRIDALADFEKNLNEDLPESHWQNWFSKNKWILGSEFAQILDDRHIDTQNIADYLVKSIDGFVDVVEIKKPNGMSFWSVTLDHGNYVPSSDLIKAIVQCQNYIFEIERESNSIKFQENVNGAPVASPHCLLVFGRSNNWNQKQHLAFRLLNASLSRIAIITYDQLFERASNVLGTNGK